MIAAAIAIAALERSYVNVRYSYQLCYPAALLHPRPEAPNGDGRTFAGAGGAELAVWGRYRLNDTLAGDTARRRRGYEADGTRITYAVTRPSFAVLSGRRGAQVLYLRTIAAGDRLLTFTLRYPAVQAARWNPVAARLSACFRAGEASF
jgi:hypothetical protein